VRSAARSTHPSRLRSMPCQPHYRGRQSVSVAAGIALAHPRSLVLKSLGRKLLGSAAHRIGASLKGCFQGERLRRRGLKSDGLRLQITIPSPPRAKMRSRRRRGVAARAADCLGTGSRSEEDGEGHRFRYDMTAIWARTRSDWKWSRRVAKGRRGAAAEVLRFPVRRELQGYGGSVL
jgi:hypothetical protein